MIHSQAHLYGTEQIIIRNRLGTPGPVLTIHATSGQDTFSLHFNGQHSVDLLLVALKHVAGSYRDGKEVDCSYIYPAEAAEPAQDR